MVGGVWGYQRGSLAEFLRDTPCLPSPPPGDLFWGAGSQVIRTVAQGLPAHHQGADPGLSGAEEHAGERDWHQRDPVSEGWAWLPGSHANHHRYHHTHISNWHACTPPSLSPLPCHLLPLRDEFSRPYTPPSKPSTSSAAREEEDAEPDFASRQRTEQGSEALSQLAGQMGASMAAAKASAAGMVDPEIERKREEAMKIAWGGAAPGASVPAASAAAELSMEDLEAELQRRKAAAQAQAQMPQQLSADGDA
jgi:hypothetical protein